MNRAQRRATRFTKQGRREHERLATDISEGNAEYHRHRALKIIDSGPLADVLDRAVTTPTKASDT